MKNLIVLLTIVFLSLNSFGQQIKGDTLIIKYSEAIKFIKIGNDVYQIESPKIKIIVPVITNGYLTDTVSYWRYRGGSPILLGTSFENKN